jgi:hypothetical protein
MDEDEGEYFPVYGSSGNGKVIKKELPSPCTHELPWAGALGVAAALGGTLLVMLAHCWLASSG